MTSLDSLDINPKILIPLKRAGLTDFVTILSLSTSDLQRTTKLSQGDLTALKTAVAQNIVAVSPITALNIYKKECPKVLKQVKLTTGCDLIDKALRGGILSNGITEISGESASGKTQFGLQLCLTVQLPIQHGGLEGGAAYICTEDVFPNKRLYQMIQYFNKRKSDIAAGHTNFGDNIFIEHVSDIDGLSFCIKKKLPLLLTNGGVKLIIIDSVAGLFRSEYEVKEMVQRSKHISSMTSKLRQLSDQYNIPVVCINQVTDTMKNGDRKHTPALGLTWANQITSRIMLSRTQQQIMLPKTFVKNAVIGGFPTIVRTLEVVFAPHLAMVTVPYIVDQEGVKDLPQHS